MVKSAMRNEQEQEERENVDCDEIPPSNQEKIETEAYAVDSISSTQISIIEHVARNPGELNKKIAKTAGCSPSHAAQTRRKFKDTILQRGLELGEELDKFQISDGRGKNSILTYTNLTEVQKFIISQYNEIKQETDKSKKEIIKHILDDTIEKLTTCGERAPDEYIRAVINDFSHLYSSKQDREPREDMPVRTKFQQESVERKKTYNVQRKNLSECEEMYKRLEIMKNTLSFRRRIAEVEAEQQRGEATSTIARAATLESVEEEIEEILEST
jgi:hypothetical protein